MRLPNILPTPVSKPFLIDPWAFVGALLGAPLLVALLGCWMVLIPVFALYFGGPLYLVLGTPALLWFLPRYGIRPWHIALLAVAVNLVGSTLLLGVLPYIYPRFQADDFAALYLGFGTPHAFAWGLAFGYLYPLLERETFRALNTHAH